MAGLSEQVVTGDAVVLDVQPAQLPVRAVSALIDLSVVFIAYILGVVLWATTLRSNSTTLQHCDPDRARIRRLSDHSRDVSQGKTFRKDGDGLRVVFRRWRSRAVALGGFRALAASSRSGSLRQPLR